MSSWKYVIPLTPIAWSRANPYAKFHCKPFDPQKKEKIAYAIYLEGQMPDMPPLTGPIRMDVCFYFQVAKSRMRQARRENWKYHFQNTPDRSNCLKFIEDVTKAVNMISDDRIYCAGEVIKYWTFDNDPRTEFILTQL